ncbi:MAG: methionyl-tRNA formyltransferase [Rubrivivax sp.]
MRIAFAGTPEFARVALEALHGAGHDVPLVLTQPDRPAGRGLKLQASPVKQFALEHGLAVAQPRGLRLDGRWSDDAASARATLEAAAPEAMVVAAYGLILPAWVLSLPRHGCLNLHGSLLPRWRGAAPIQRAIEAGDRQTGIVLMQMDTGLDTGPMLLTATEPVLPDDTSASLHDRLAPLAAKLMLQGLDALAAGTLKAIPQPGEGVTYAAKIEKSEARIDWTRPAAEIERRLRAFDPFPGCSFAFQDELAKLWRAQVVPMNGVPGEVLAAGDGPLVVACGEQALALTRLQWPGGRRVDAAEFLAARPGLGVPSHLS